MKKRWIALLSVLAVVAGLIPAVFADVSAGVVLYERTANGEIIEDFAGAWVTNAGNDGVNLIDAEGRKYASFKTYLAAQKSDSAYIDVDLDYMVDAGEETKPPFGMNFAGGDYEAVHLSFIYAYRYDSPTNYYNLGQYEKTRVRVSTDDGETWSEAYAVINAQSYLGDGKMQVTAQKRFSLYEVVCDLTDILPKGQTVTHIRIEPVGEGGLQEHSGFCPNLDLHQVKIIGYKKAKDAPAFEQPKQISMQEETLRQIVVNYVKQNLAGYEWTAKEDADEYKAGHSYKGVPHATFNTAESSSFARFLSIVDENHVADLKKDIIYGMDGAAALADLLTNVSRAHINGLAQSADTNRLTPLGGLSLKVPGSSKPNWRTAHSGITAEQAYEAYALAKPGDVSISTKGSSQLMIVTGETTVVRGTDGKIDPEASTVVVTNTPSSNLWYHYMVDGTEVVSKQEPSAYLAGKPGGTLLYGTHWTMDRVVSFKTLWNGVAASDSAPQVRSGHMIYSLYEYETEKVDELQVQCISNFDIYNARSGVSLGVSTNYRLVSAQAVLTDKSTGKELFNGTHYFAWSNFSGEYNDPNLNAVMAELPDGEYNLTVSVKSGPITDPEKLETPEVQVLDQDFKIIPTKLTLAAGQDKVNQGEKLSIHVVAQEDGLTGIKVGVSYDMDRYAFDLQGSMDANPGFVFTENKLLGIVTAEGSFSSAAKGDVLVKLSYTALPTGNKPLTGDDTPVFAIGQSSLVTAKGERIDGYAKGQSAKADIGYNVQICKEYVKGWDLVLVHMSSETPLTYDGTSMYNVSETGYLLDGSGFPCVYGYLTQNASVEKVTSGAAVGPEIQYGLDVNMSGWLDLNDVQQVANVISGKVSPSQDMVRCIAADVNKDGKADMKDMALLLNKLR